MPKDPATKALLVRLCDQPQGDNTSWADGPEVRIRIKIDKTGKYYFWQRVGGSSNSGYLGIDTARYLL